MDSIAAPLPTDLRELHELVRHQQRELAEESENRHAAEQRADRSESRIQTLEEIVRRLQAHRFGKRSERHPGQFHLFNEAELLVEEVAEEPLPTADASKASPKPARKRPAAKALSPDLPRVEVIHDLTDAEKQCHCGKQLRLIGEEVLEQLAVIPQQFYVVRHVKKKYACECKRCVRTASMPVQPLPGSQVSPQLISHLMVSKYVDGLPLYRLEKSAGRDGVDLARANQARWLVKSSTAHFQPVFNLLQDSFFGYDIAWSDDTGIQVLKEPGRAPEKKSYLWIRRGGPPDKPVVLLDYSPSKSGETAYSLLDEFHGYLVSDAAGNFNLSVKNNGLTQVLCNDHARRRFHEVLVGLKASARRTSVAYRAIEHYNGLYALERDIADQTPAEKYAARQERAVPAWAAFLTWARTMYVAGVAHDGTRNALKYLLKHADGLQRYCDDGRLPISNILSEHVAKTVAIARKNFLFADTTAGAKASAMIFSLLETAKANGHHPQRYLSVLLTEVPNATGVEDIEALLPWAIDPAEVERRYQSYPTI